MYGILARTIGGFMKFEGDSGRTWAMLCMHRPRYGAKMSKTTVDDVLGFGLRTAAARP